MKRETWVRRLAVLLCIALCVPSFLLAMPTTETEAATKYWGYLDNAYCRDANGNYSTRNIKLQVESGQEFNIGDWAHYYSYKNNSSVSKRLSEIKGVKYKSTNKKAVTLNNKGVAKTKKLGTTTITMKKGKINIKFQIQVVKKGSLTKLVKGSKDYQARMKNAIKSTGGKVTEKNHEAFWAEIEKTGKNAHKMKKLEYGLYKKGYYYTNKVLVPQYLTYTKYLDQFAECVNDCPAVYFNEQMDSDTPQMLQATSMKVTGSLKTGELQLKEKISLKDILGLLQKDLYSYMLMNSPGYKDTYKNTIESIHAPFTISGVRMAIVDAEGLQYDFEVTVQYGSDKAQLTFDKDVALDPGTYTLNETAKKYIGDLTVTIQ